MQQVVSLLALLSTKVQVCNTPADDPPAHTKKKATENISSVAVAGAVIEKPCSCRRSGLQLQRLRCFSVTAPATATLQDKKKDRTSQALQLQAQ
jgi:hypothetical protein